jgi:hypothetical protein
MSKKMIIAAGLHFLGNREEKMARIFPITNDLPASHDDAGFCAIDRNIYKFL